MGKLFANIAGVAVGCLGAHQLIGGGWKALGIGLAACVLSNLVGLSQQPPTFGGSHPS